LPASRAFFGALRALSPKNRRSVGGDLHVTINPDMADRLIAADTPVQPRFNQAINQAQTERLAAALPDFQAAWAEDGLAEADYEEYGPVLHFLASFKKGWVAVREELSAVKA
jgi:hypothetical protein